MPRSEFCEVHIVVEELECTRYPRSHINTLKLRPVTSGQQSLIIALHRSRKCISCVELGSWTPSHPRNLVSSFVILSLHIVGWVRNTTRSERPRAS
jgi:hypothetical protein